MKLITWNVNGIRARAAQVQELIATEQPDVICLQEIKASPSQVPELLVAPEGYWSHWHGAGGYSGVAVMVRHGFATKPTAVVHLSFDIEQRVCVAERGGLRVVWIYVPSAVKDRDAKINVLNGLGAWAGDTDPAESTLIMWGDLNVSR